MSDTNENGIVSGAITLKRSTGDVLAEMEPRRARESATLLGMPVEVLELTLPQRLEVMQSGIAKGPGAASFNATEFYPLLILHGVVEVGTDTPVFSSRAALDAASKKHGGSDFQRLGETLMRISGLSGEAEKKILGNSEAAELAA